MGRKHIVNVADASKVYCDKNLCLYMNETEKFKSRLSKLPEIELIKKAQQGDKKARDLIIINHAKFVVKVAAKYQSKYFSLKDLISVGNEGLITAVDKYDLNKHNVKFISVAVWWIRSAILDYIKENQFVRIPNNRVYEIAKLEKELEFKIKKYGIDYGIVDLTDKKNKNDKDNLMSSYYLTKEIASIDEFLELEDNLVSVQNNLFYEDEIAESNLLMNACFKVLTEEEKNIFVFKFGIYDDFDKSISDVASFFNISHKKASNIIESCVKKIKSLLIENK